MRDLLEELDPFAAHRGFDIDESRHVAAGARQACDESAADRIGHNDEYDRDGPGLTRQRGGARSCVRDDQIGLRNDELLRKSLDALDIACAKTVVDLDVATLDPTLLSESPLERLQERSGL